MSALIYAPFPDRETARQVATQLLDEKLIACANLLGAMESLYEWNGERGSGEEIAVLMKTEASVLDAAVARLESLHPYDTPAVLGWKCDAAGAATTAWLGALRPAQ
ncbi:divalent-cation tolerance protein CutA [Erythrobacter litoralis]|uniref:Periplasmic divalent cation tolerance protein n=1 Tax=Erythrobacter litoralis (strain HTCC2594) TaxID=314225 RepID=Q2N6M8_ERYLH|nr:divalent-cation tolerance protein CutA [Erythrobacter litoralis]ABC64663.1 Periplasmic divalent cation tolerance protein [Erythrobacter litoralis HTCC2594]